MEQKINIAELLKDCPTGMELDCTMYDSVTLLNVNDREDITFPIKVLREDGNYIPLTKYGQYTYADFAKCVIFPKGKTTWEGFHRPFMDGDIVVCTNESCTFTAIFKGMRNDSSFYRYGVMYDNEFRCLVNDWSDFNDSCRLATEEQCTLLFRKIKEAGYHWNPETKTLEKLIEPKFKVGDVIQDIDGYKVRITEVNVEDEYYLYKALNINWIGCISINRQDNWELVPDKFAITTLKPFDKVLVRDDNTQRWTADLFSFYDRSLVYPYSCVGHYTNQCVPFESNKHLLGKTDDCDEYFKTWEE